MKGNKKRFKLIKDILTENDKYSQGRVYLFISVIAYYFTLGILTLKGVHVDKEGNASDIDLESFSIIVNALKWAMALFAGYVFGGKGIEVLKILSGKKNEP